MSDTISWNQTKLRPVLQKNISSCLLRIDSDTILCDDGGGRRIDFKFFSCKFYDRCEWNTSQHTKPVEIIIYETKLANRFINSYCIQYTFTYTLNGNFGSDVRVTLNFTFESSSSLILLEICKSTVRK